MTTLAEEIERSIQRRVNYDRASAFGRPVLKSLDEDALLVGYSVTSVDGEDIVLEANHVSRRSLSDASPIAFTTRTFKSLINAESEWIDHAMDHIANGRLHSATPSPNRKELRSLMAKQFAQSVLIDGRSIEGTAFTVGESRFVRLCTGDPLSLITIAAPTTTIFFGFSTRISE